LNIRSANIQGYLSQTFHFFRVKHSHLIEEEQTAWLKSVHHPFIEQPKILYHPLQKADIGIIARLRMEDLEMKEYEILSDTGSCRKLVAKINRMAS